MYVKIFNQILDSSIADDRRLRHFFIDLLLCSDPDGNVLMTKRAIANRIKATAEEVDWGLSELMKPDPMSNHADFDGRRIIPLEGHGYGWKIVNYALYRDMKSARQLREESAERVRRHRAKKGNGEIPRVQNEPETEQVPQSADRPSLNEVLHHANTIGLGAWKAEDWFNEMEGCGWLDHNKRPVMKWQSLIQRVKTKWDADGHPTGPPASKFSTEAQGGGKPRKMTNDEIVAAARS